MCFQQHDPLHLSTELLERALAHAHVMDEFQFTGGEPFLSKWLQTYLAEFDTTSGQKLGFTTNASLLHQFRNDLEGLPRLHLGISLDAATKETYAKIRQGGDWEQVTKNVNWFAEQRLRRRPMWDTGRLAYVIMRSNYEEIPAFAEWARELEIPVMFCLMFGDFSPGENLELHREQLERLTPPMELYQRVETIVRDMPDYERSEILMSIKHCMNQLTSPIDPESGS